MKKSKIIIPALALTAFSMAASITGAVAWFTANRVATVTAGEFAVVNTTSDLSVQMGNGVGTTGSDASGHVVNVTSGYKLTDGSLDHVSTTHKIVAPDITGNYIGSEAELSNNSLGSLLLRDASNNVYTAFTWTMTFQVSFAGSSSLDAGLFLDLSSEDSYMHRKVTYNKGDLVNDVAHYSDAACTTAAAAIAVDGDNKSTSDDPITVYEEAPIETGKAFRIAFIPTSIGGTGENESVAYSKVWAKNEAKDYCGFIDTADSDYNTDGTVLLSACEADYGTATSKLSGHTGSLTADSATAGTDKVLMDSSCVAGIPNNSTVSDTTALSGNANYLGMFKVDPGKTVSITYTCVAWFDGTDTDAAHGHIVTNASNFETIVTSMKFGVSNLLAA